ncbi:MAG: hypothetical protein KBB86_00530 [Candidatus Pacebacteria bacterium]|nr:hypothetical protein [Candidatus Paceibacterota bacterium]
MSKEEKNNSILSPKTWRFLVNVWTIFLYVAIVIDYLKSNSLEKFLGPICAIYVALLAIYTAEKEFERWHDYNVGRHPGEIYIIIWTVIIITMFLLGVFHPDKYQLPSEVFSTYIVVMGILAITRKSKTDYLCKNDNE